MKTTVLSVYAITGVLCAMMVGPVAAIEEVFVPAQVDYPGFKGVHVGLSGTSILWSNAHKDSKSIDLPDDIDFGLGVFGGYEVYFLRPWSVSLRATISKTLATWKEYQEETPETSKNNERDQKRSGEAHADNTQSLDYSGSFDACVRLGYVMKSMRPYLEAGPSIARVAIAKGGKVLLGGMRVGGGVGFSFGNNIMTELGYVYSLHWRGEKSAKKAQSVSRHGVILSLSYRF